MGITNYQKSWEKEYTWLAPKANDIYSAYCKICLKSFKIDKSGVGQVKSHAKCHESNKRKAIVSSWQTQRTFNTVGKGIELSKDKSVIPLTPKEACLKAEVLHALHMVHTNQSFASAENDGA